MLDKDLIIHKVQELNEKFSEYRITYEAKAIISVFVDILNERDADTEEIQRLHIGDFGITDSIQYPDKIYIIRKTGEGGTFDKKKFTDAIEKFYEENF